MSNLGWFFYKDYFNDINWNDLKSNFNEKNIKNKIIKLIDQQIKIKESLNLGNIYFTATTTYPGLLIGSGYLHELPDIKGQAILGFDFDYTTGLPVIRGSSIKGVLRSAFEHPEYIQDILNNNSIDVEDLKQDIFENQKDIFFDAEIVKAGTKILEDDYITPHKETLKNPIPLRFIKIAPNVTFRFDFVLTDYKKDNIFISKNDKVILFAQILCDLGIGAKTNVGYGKFEDNLVERTKRILKDIEEKQKEEERQKREEERKLKEQQELEGKSNIEQIKHKIKDKTKKDTKEIYEIIGKYKLNEKEREELKKILQDKIGSKPKPKNRAAIKWAIRIYEDYLEK